MLHFVNDYSECAHEEILKKIAEINYEKINGYGSDHYCDSAKEKIRKACDCPAADVYFVTGGTQTNQLVIDTMLMPYEGVVAADTGHVSVHEAGAIEYTGHKVLTVPGKDGKMCAADLKKLLKIFYADGNHEHMVFPGMVYISHPTEYGTLYTRAELQALRTVCDNYKLPLYLDGARLSYGLTADGTDVTMKDIAELTDVFYIGGTKCGALFGEAIVFTKNNTPAHFITRVKQHGALLAKGWLLGVQFDVLFTDGLYERIGRNAIDTAEMLKKALTEKGYRFLLTSPTNQILIILENARMEELAEKVAFSFWETIDDTHTAIRFCTSWATKKEDVAALIEIL